MNFKYWQWESHELAEKKKKPSVKEIALVIEDNETSAYRLARVLCLAKAKGSVALKEMPADLPKATWHRYLETAYHLGFLDKKDNRYYNVNRFTNPLANFADYYEKWQKNDGVESEEDLRTLFPKAEKGKYGKKTEITQQ